MMVLDEPDFPSNGKGVKYEDIKEWNDEKGR